MEAATGRELHRIELPGTAVAVHFTPTGNALEIVHHASHGADVVRALYTLDPADLIREACGKVTRNLTLSEWKQYSGSEIPYRRTCENK
jgi:hypothetical protein